MISQTVIKEHLALDRRTFTELAAGFTAIAVAGATLYNLSFFAPIDSSLILDLPGKSGLSYSPIFGQISG